MGTDCSQDVLIGGNWAGFAFQSAPRTERLPSNYCDTFVTSKSVQVSVMHIDSVYTGKGCCAASLCYVTAYMCLTGS